MMSLFERPSIHEYKGVVFSYKQFSFSALLIQISFIIILGRKLNSLNREVKRKLK